MDTVYTVLGGRPEYISSAHSSRACSVEFIPSDRLLYKCRHAYEQNALLCILSDLEQTETNYPR